MSEASQRICPWCQSVIKSDAITCWKCGLGSGAAHLKRDISNRTRATLNPASSARPQHVLSFGLSSLMIATATIAILSALMLASPGLGIAASLLLVVPLVRTRLVVHRRALQGETIGLGERTLLFIGSAWTTLVIVVVVGVASVGTFCATCLGLYGAMGEAGSAAVNGMVIASGLLTLTVVSLLLWGFSKWIRARWRRDTRQ